jgi:hypothetical protein
MPASAAIARVVAPAMPCARTVVIAALRIFSRVSIGAPPFAEGWFSM